MTGISSDDVMDVFVLAIGSMITFLNIFLHGIHYAMKGLRDMEKLVVFDYKNLIPETVDSVETKFITDMATAMTDIRKGRDEGRDAFDIESSVRVFKTLKARFPEFIFDGPEAAISYGPDSMDDTMVFVVAASQQAYEMHEARR